MNAELFTKELRKKGRLVILATEATMTAMFPDTIFDEQSITEADENPFKADCTIVPDAYMYADCRMTRSERNRVFTRWVSEALHEGKDIVLITPSADRLDKRLRERDRVVTFSLPKKEE